MRSNVQVIFYISQNKVHVGLSSKYTHPWVNISRIVHLLLIALHSSGVKSNNSQSRFSMNRLSVLLLGMTARPCCVAQRSRICAGPRCKSMRLVQGPERTRHPTHFSRAVSQHSQQHLFRTGARCLDPFPTPGSFVDRMTNKQ
ncbi:d-xylose reductase [Moniliophthora roreri]|nr:d-xylose reductase [Moniliophthora roreri]